MLKRLLPKMLPSDNKGFFNSIDDVHVISSGNAVTPARSRPPITAFDMVLVLLRLSAYIDSLMLKYIGKNENIKKSDKNYIISNTCNFNFSIYINKFTFFYYFKGELCFIKIR